MNFNKRVLFTKKFTINLCERYLVRVWSMPIHQIMVLRTGDLRLTVDKNATLTTG